MIIDKLAEIITNILSEYNINNIQDYISDNVDYYILDCNKISCILNKDIDLILNELVNNIDINSEESFIKEIKINDNNDIEFYIKSEEYVKEMLSYMIF